MITKARIVNEVDVLVDAGQELGYLSGDADYEIICSDAAAIASMLRRMVRAATAADLRHYLGRSTLSDDGTGGPGVADG